MGESLHYSYSFENIFKLSKKLNYTNSDFRYLEIFSRKKGQLYFMQKQKKNLPPNDRENVRIGVTRISSLVFPITNDIFWSFYHYWALLDATKKKIYINLYYIVITNINYQNEIWTVSKD